MRAEYDRKVEIFGKTKIFGGVVCLYWRELEDNNFSDGKTFYLFYGNYGKLNQIICISQFCIKLNKFNNASITKFILADIVGSFFIQTSYN